MTNKHTDRLTRGIALSNPKMHKLLKIFTIPNEETRAKLRRKRKKKNK